MRNLISRHSDDPSGYPFGSSDWGLLRHSAIGYAQRVVVEIAVVLLTIVGFVILDLYVIGCEKV